MDEGLLSIISAGCGQLVKMLIPLEPHNIFRSNYAGLFKLTLSSHWYANGDKALSSIIMAGQGILVKMLIILELHHIF